MNIELERKKLELKKVETAMSEMEFRILERLHDIERLKENIENQKKAIEGLCEQIKNMENK